MPLADAAPLTLTAAHRTSAPTWRGERWADLLVAYALAVLLCFAAVLLEQSLPAAMAQGSLFVVLVLAVLASAQAGGFGPGLLAALLGALLANYHLLAPQGAAAGNAATAVFLVAAVATSVLGARARACRRQVRRSRERFSRLDEAAADLIWSCDRDGQPDDVSGGWRDFAGNGRSDSPVRSWESLVHPADAELLRTRMGDVVRSGRPVDVECRFWRRDGEARWFWTRIAPVKDGLGRVTRLVAVSRDVEERRRADEQRGFELERERTRRQCAEAEADLRDRVMAILGHDLRQPLSVIEVCAALLRKRGLEQRRDRESVELLSRNARRADRMVRDLLDWTLVGSAGVLPVAPHPADLRQICARALEDARAQVPGSALELDAKEPLVGSWDAERMQQLLSNLIGNAFKHGRDDRPVRLTARREDDAAIIEVHNEGTPIPAGLHHAIFEPFTRGPEASKRHCGGIGMGLFIVREIARAHGGTVGLRSTAAEGTTFQVRLPVAGPGRASRAVPERGCPGDRARRRAGQDASARLRFDRRHLAGLAGGSSCSSATAKARANSLPSST